MDDAALLNDLHRRQPRQGPGGAHETALAIALSGLARNHAPVIADIGCGAGASTLILAEALGGAITAVDLFPEFLSELEARAAKAGVSDKIETRAASMDGLPFTDGSLDAIWSEGAVYNIGFENGARSWRRFLKPGGVIALSELTWLTKDRPQELHDHWVREYAEVDTASAKIGVLEAEGYMPLGYFPLPKSCWLDNYYRPLEAGFDDFLARHDGAEAARAIVEGEREEIALYERFSDYFGYGFYVARKVES